MKNKKRFYLKLNILLASVAVISALFVLYGFLNNSREVNKAIITQSPKSQRISLSKTSEGKVVVTVTPQELKSGSQEAFEVQFNTHSVGLDYEIAQLSDLKDDKGNIYKPVSWTGGKGGHHINGILTFPPIFDSVKNVTLTILNIDNQDRIFNWDIK